MSTDQGRGASSPQVMRRANRQALLRLALQGSSFTASDAMAATGLTRATVLGVCAELGADGWIVEDSSRPADARARTGRPARRYRLDSSGAVLLGIDAGEHTLAVQVTDLTGAEQATAHAVVEAPDGPAATAEQRIEALSDLIERALVQADATGARRVLTVVGVPAPVDEDGASPEDSVGFWRRMNPGLVTALAHRGASHVLVENDADLAAIAEHASGAGPHVVTLLTGQRLGAGLVVDGRLLRGEQGGAGELSVLDLALGDRGHGTDGVVVLARRWAQDLLSGDPLRAQASPLSRIVPARLTAEDVFGAAAAGDALAAQVLERLGERLARVSVILAGLLGARTVVVAGALAEVLEPVLEHSRAAIPRIVPPPHPRLVASRHGADVVARGAVELAVHHLRADPLQHLDRARQ